MAKRILLIDDEAYKNKCEKIRQYMEKRGISYDVAVTLEEALEKVMLDLYGGIILDMYFPDREGEKRNGAGRKLLEILKEKGKQIPVIIYSTSGGIEHELVLGQTFPGDPKQIEKVEGLINHTLASDAKEIGE